MRIYDRLDLSADEEFQSGTDSAANEGNYVIVSEWFLNSSVNLIINYLVPECSRFVKSENGK